MGCALGYDGSPARRRRPSYGYQTAGLTFTPGWATLSIMGSSSTKSMAVGVIRRLHKAGYEAMFAGGCVRDMLMGRRASDYDVATSATPRQVKKLFGHVLMVGAKFGVAMVIIQRRTVEVTTFRSDLSYSDGRRPDEVRFVSARRDAQRRDFTINGMFYDPLCGKVIDYVGGRGDLDSGVIRAIGDPRRRFAEDYLRMLRAVRFAGRLGFRIDDATAGAIKRNAPRISQISGERIREELEKMLADASAAWSLNRLGELGLVEAILPEMFEKPETWPASLRRVEATGNRRRDVITKFAAMLCNLPPGDVRRIVRRWGGSNDMRNSLVWISEHLHDWKTIGDSSLAGLKRLLAHRDFGRLEMLWRIEERAASGGKTVMVRAIRRRIGKIDPRRISPPPLVTGSDLKKMGVGESPVLGRILRAVYEEQLNERIAGRREAMQMARNLIVAH